MIACTRYRTSQYIIDKHVAVVGVEDLEAGLAAHQDQQTMTAPGSSDPDEVWDAWDQEGWEAD